MGTIYGILNRLAFLYGDCGWIAGFSSGFIAADLPTLEADMAQILDQYDVADYLQVRYQGHTSERQIRAYKERPARTECSVRYELSVTRDVDAIAQAERQMGWRLYVTNAPEQRLSLPEALRTYRGGVSTIERDFSRFKGRPFSNHPNFGSVQFRKASARVCR